MVEQLTAMTFEVGHGRVLEGYVDTARTRRALVWCHGTPFPVVPWAPLVDACRARGLTFVAWARPGYAGSSPRPGRRVLDVCDDATAVLDRLGIDEAIAAGWSGGGPHSLALGAGLPARCRAVLSIASVAPGDAASLDWTAGMGPENVEEFGLARQGGPAFEAWLVEAQAQLGTVDAASLAASMAGLLSDVDGQALAERGMAAMLARSLRSAAGGSTAGWRDDDGAFLAPWGFDPAAIDVPVRLWQGSEDLMVPHAHGAWLAAALPQAVATMATGEGHISLLTRRLDEMLDDVVEAAGA
jgi:pimeloyl-ACP methyl ester carboxylesterase